MTPTGLRVNCLQLDATRLPKETYLASPEQDVPRDEDCSAEISSKELPVVETNQELESGKLNCDGEVKDVQDVHLDAISDDEDEHVKDEVQKATVDHLTPLSGEGCIREKGALPGIDCSNQT